MDQDRRLLGETCTAAKALPSQGAAALTWRVGWKRFLKYVGFIVQRLERETREPSVGRFSFTLASRHARLAGQDIKAAQSL